MVSTATSRLGLRKQAVGDNVNLWGLMLNTDVFDLTDEAFGVSIILSISGDFSLTNTNYATNQARRSVLQLNGSPSADFSATVPVTDKGWEVHNRTAKNATIKMSTGATVVVRSGMISYVYADGTDCWLDDPTLDQIKAPAAAVDLNSKKITSLATATALTDAVNKGQMDTAIAAATWTIAGTIAAGTITNQFIRWNNTAHTFEAYEIPVLVAGSGTTVTGTFTAGTMAVDLAGWKVKTGDYTAIKNDRIIASSGSGAINITAPASPSVGDNFTVARDGANTVTIVRNSSTIGGDASDLTLSATGQVANLICSASNTWKVIGGTLK